MHRTHRLPPAPAGREATNRLDERPERARLSGEYSTNTVQGDRSRIDRTIKMLARVDGLEDEENLGGEAFVGKLDAPEIAGGKEDFDAEFEASRRISQSLTRMTRNSWVSWDSPLSTSMREPSAG